MSAIDNSAIVFDDEFVFCEFEIVLDDNMVMLLLIVTIMVPQQLKKYICEIRNTSRSISQIPDTTTRTTTDWIGPVIFFLPASLREI